LPERLRRGLPLSRYDRSIFYGGDACGYIDYPAAEVASAA
jgi:N-ethylmaleimide reductase